MVFWYVFLIHDHEYENLTENLGCVVWYDNTIWNGDNLKISQISYITPKKCEIILWHILYNMYVNT
jgi:hypothetical protein